MCGKSLGIGTQNPILLIGENPAAAGIGVVGIPAFKHEAGEPFPQLLLQRNQQFVHGKHGIIRFVAGVNCGNLFVPDQQERIRIVYGQTGVEYIGKVCAAEFGKCCAIDLCAFGQRFVGRTADGIDISIHIQRKAKVGGGVLNCVLAGTCGKRCGVTVQGRGRIQWLHVKVFDLTSAPTGCHTQCLVITEHGRIVVKVCFKVVVTG